MKIFVGYGFRGDRDKWIPDLVYPIIRSFGDEVVTGEELKGDRITDAVVQKIKESDALIGFLTRREEPDANGTWKTHRWVIEEITTAINNKKPFVEVRETRVDNQDGIAGDRQHITYDEHERDKCLVEVVKIIGKWHRFEKMKLKVLPEEYIRELSPLLRDPDLRCSYQIMTAEFIEGEEIVTKLIPITGGLFIIARDVPRQALIKVHIEHHGKHWHSDYESSDSLGIHLRKEI